jgi:hypothetical protein
VAKLRTKSGDELSTKDVEALAEEAERGYDLDRARRARVGRPSLGKRGASPRIQIRIDPQLDRALRRRARAERRSVSDLARRALRSYVDGSP